MKKPEVKTLKELEHDLQKKPGSQIKKKLEDENSEGSCEGKGAEIEHDPQKKPDSENKKKPDGENKKVAGARKGVSLRKSVVRRSKIHVSLSKQDK